MLFQKRRKSLPRSTDAACPPWVSLSKTRPPKPTPTLPRFSRKLTILTASISTVEKPNRKIITFYHTLIFPEHLPCNRCRPFDHEAHDPRLLPLLLLILTPLPSPCSPIPSSSDPTQPLPSLFSKHSNFPTHPSTRYPHPSPAPLLILILNLTLLSSHPSRHNLLPRTPEPKITKTQKRHTRTNSPENLSSVDRPNPTAVSLHERPIYSSSKQAGTTHPRYST